MAPKLKLSYFNIEGAAEKVRLAFKLGGVEFQDERVDFNDWPALKPTTPFGQLPILTIDDHPPVTQSNAMLRYAGKISGLLPEDPIEALRVDEVLGLLDDMQRSLSPSMYIMRTPQALGHPADFSEESKKAAQDKMRAALIAEDGDIRRYLGYLEGILTKSGNGYFVGKTATIADCAVLPSLRMYKSGRLDGIPSTVIDAYPNLSAFFNRMMDLPAIKAHYAK